MFRIPFSRLALLALPTAIALSGCDQADPQAASSRILYVTAAADGEYDDFELVSASPTFTTIQDAINAASSGDTVSVPSGSYYEDLAMKDGVKVVGAGQSETYLYGTATFTSHAVAPSLESMTLFDYTYALTGTKYTETAITINGGEADIEDVGAYYFNYAISINGGTGVTINDVKLGGNWYGVVDTSSTDLLVTNSFIYSNPAGGIATSNGGGTTAIIVHNTFIGNGYGGSTAYLTGAMSMGSGGSEVVANNIMTSNYYGLNCYSCSSTWRNNLVWGNTTGYVNDASAHSTDLSQDPLFADASGGNYGLSASSPLIDAGSSTYGVYAPGDKDGESRPQGAGYDIGFDEYTTSSYELIITEVMANAKTESTGEFVEIYNAGSSDVDLAGLILSDGDEDDELVAYSGGTTTLAPGEYAVVIDPDYASDYTIASGVTLLTVADTNLGNGMTTADDVTLYESDGSTVISTFSFPKDPGDGISMEMVDMDTGDAAGNWRASACTGGSSPGAEECFAESGDPSSLIITEVMANASSEATGEYIEVYNPTDTEIDLAGLVIKDSANSDTLTSFNSFSTTVGPYSHALILDSGYTFDYYLPTSIAVVTAGTTLGNGLSTSDSVYLYDTDGTTLIDSFTSPSDPGDGYSIEKIDYTVGDTATNWAAATDYSTRGRSPGLLNGAAGGVAAQLNITEVMANADDEDTGEYIEIFNSSTETIDLAGLMISDGDATDTLQSYDGGSTELASGAYALVLDAEYAGEYTIDSSVVLMTTGDTTLGNGLSVSDEVTLYEADGIHLIDAFMWPRNPGNAISTERLGNNSAWDTTDNWASCSSAAGGTPGAVNSNSSSGPGASSYDIVITEVMANALTESTGEFVELYNNGSTAVDLIDWVFWDGDAVDTIHGYSSYYDTVLDPGEYAVILDADYAGEYTIPSTALLLVTDDSTIGSGLAVNDEVYLYEAGAAALVSTYTFPFDPGNGYSAELIDLATGDASGNWQKSPCSAHSSPGDDNC